MRLGWGTNLCKKKKENKTSLKTKDFVYFLIVCVEPNPMAVNSEHYSQKHLQNNMILSSTPAIE